jgi:hypothetical protein
VNGNLFIGLFGIDLGVRLDEPDRSNPATLSADWTTRTAKSWIAEG